MYLADNPDRYKFYREQMDPALLEAANIRGVIDTFERAKSYWAVIRYLSGGSSIKFFSIDEALGEVRTDCAKDPTAQNRARIAVAEHFSGWRDWQ